MNYTALIVAAGSGSRMGLGYNKLLYKLKNGNTILEETVQTFLRDTRCTQVIIAASSCDMHTFTSLFTSGKVVFVRGGETRQDSVYQGLKAVKEDYLLIHDGARPWISRDCIDRLIHALTQYKACLLMVPVKDTIKVVTDGIVKETLDRSMLRCAQTPQAFETDLIIHAYQQAHKEGIQATDDAQLVELCTDERVREVMGSYENEKVTTIEDLEGK